jgi:hypothetical protein
MPCGKGCVRPEELLAEDLGQEDVVSLVLGFEFVAADSSVGAAEVTGFPGLVQRAEGVGNVLRELRASDGVDGFGGWEGYEGSSAAMIFLARPERGWDKARSLCLEPAGFWAGPRR